MLELRKMNSEEFDYYSRFSFEEFLTESAKSAKQDIETLRASLGKAPDQPTENDLWLVFSFDGQNIGFLWVQLRPEKKAAFGYDIYLDEKFRSKGLGKEIMLRCTEMIREKGINRVEICVFQDNEIARKLYSSLGFKEIKYNSERRQYTLEITL